MSVRRIIIGSAATLAVIAIAVSGWDFLKARRHAPILATPENRATLIVVEKEARRLTLFHDNRPIKSYQVSLGQNPIGPKQREGDSRTPEGKYSIDSKNGRSRFHLALHISYPDGEDRARAARERVPPGGDIMIHGLPNGLGWLGALLLSRDWTDGCVAVSNAEIEEIWALTDTGTPIEIKP